MDGWASVVLLLMMLMVKGKFHLKACFSVCVSRDLLQGYPIGRFYWNQESSTESSFLALKITTKN